MAFDYFCMGKMLEPLQISGDHVPLSIPVHYKTKQMAIPTLPSQKQTSALSVIPVVPNTLQIQDVSAKSYS